MVGGIGYAFRVAKSKANLADLGIKDNATKDKERRLFNWDAAEIAPLRFFSSSGETYLAAYMNQEEPERENCAEGRGSRIFILSRRPKLHAAMISDTVAPVGPCEISRPVHLK
jgi:hypothetical protein